MIVAWIEERYDGWLAWFRAADAPERAPAGKLFPSDHEARAWIEGEARKLRVTVHWM